MPDAPAPIAVREKGYQATPRASWSGMLDQLESNPELQWPQSIAVFDRMRREDAQVGSVLRAVSMPIRRTRFRVDGTGCRPEVAELVASDLGLPLVGAGNEVQLARTRDRFSWSEHLREALRYLATGHAVFEQKYRIGDDGLAHLAKLGHRPPRSIQAWNVGRDGGLISIEQQAEAAAKGSKIVIPINRLVVYSLERDDAEWWGNSLLRGCYKNWLLKDRLLRVQTSTIERNGMGVPTYSGAEGESDLAAGESIARAVRSGDDAGAAIPYGAKLELLGVQGDLPDAEGPIRYHDEQIARSVLAHFLNLGTQTGSWALGSTFADFFTSSLQAIAGDIAATFTDHVIEDLVTVNWGESEPAPRLVHDEIGSRRDATAEALKVLTDAGVLTTDADLEQFVRTAYNLPGKRSQDA